MPNIGLITVLPALIWHHTAYLQNNPVARASAVRFDNASVNFGKVPAAIGADRNVSVRIDRALFDSKRTHLLARNSSALRIHQISSTSKAKERVVICMYRVSVPPGMSVGPIKATLYLTGLADSKRSPSLPVVGEVVDGKPRVATNQPVLGQVIPSFTLPDIAGKPSRSVALAKRPAALFFFCGCDACRACATQWSQLQLTGALTPANTLKSGNRAEPATVIVFSGSAQDLEMFATSTGLEKQKTLLLPDPMMTATNLYGVDPCPRVFVVDANGTLRYTNNHVDDQPQKAPAEAIIARTVDTLQTIQKSK